MTQEQPQAKSNDSFSGLLLVHDFTYTAWQHKPKHQVLNDGFRLVFPALSGTSIVPSLKPIALERNSQSKRDNSFVYNKIPPFVSAVSSPASVTKEWGSGVSDDEVFALDDLKEFEATVIGLPKFGEDLELRAELHTITGELDSTPLHQIIPQPHIHPSPFLQTVPEPKGRPYNRKKPLFIVPSSEFSVDDHARMAWLIPIRGVFPWCGCSSGLLVDLPLPSIVEVNAIHWNRASLLSFWQFLLDLQRSRSLGALGVSLQVAKRPKASTEESRGISVSASSSADTISSRIERQDYSAVEYIKLYHDASRSLYVRKAVDSWSYYFGPDGKKVRVLKGATLPLLDDISTPILLC